MKSVLLAKDFEKGQKQKTYYKNIMQVKNSTDIGLYGMVKSSCLEMVKNILLFQIGFLKNLCHRYCS